MKVRYASLVCAFALAIGFPELVIGTASAAEPLLSANGKDGSAIIAGRPFQVGYRRSTFEFVAPTGGQRSRQLDIWYPTDAKEVRHNYRPQVGSVAENAPVAPGRHPLIVFSHGFLGSSDQVIFLTESCARAGYIVASMNHNDALLNRREQRMPPPRFADYEKWTDEKFRDRREDVAALLDHMLQWNKSPDSPWHDHVDESRIGGMGHSLGGYTMLGMAGGWPTWKESRLTVVVLFSPYAHPFTAKENLKDVKIPIMLQGGTLDFGVTPLLTPAYQKLGGPKMLLILNNETHFGWTNLASLATTTKECVAHGNPELIVTYTIAFFDHHLLKCNQSTFLEKANARLSSLHFESP